MEKIPTMLLVVAAALIRPNGQILLQKRPDNKRMAGLWEFPGGKVEAGEDAEGALARELGEELGIAVDKADLTPLTFATTHVEGQDMTLLLFVCHRWDGEVKALESPALKWVGVDQMALLPMPPADAPFIESLATYLDRLPRD